MLTATPDNATTIPADASRFDALRWTLVRPVDAASVAVFRILFGSVTSIGSVRVLAKGWVDDLYLTPTHHVSYAGFGWVRPLPELLMYGLVLMLAVAGAFIAVGYLYNYAMSFFVAGFTYIELIDATLYLNHYWFVSLLAVLMLVLPVNGYWSVDAARGRTNRSDSVPNLTVVALRSQIAVVYLFAGLAKLNTDWLLRAQPMQLWLADRAEVAVVGPILAEPATAFLLSWSGALFDCTIVGWLLWGRSRRFGYAAVALFHLATGALFSIGIFPLVMMTATLVYFSPDWPKQLRRYVSRAACWPAKHTSPTKLQPKPTIRPWLAGFLAMFALVQISLPLRHYFYEGNVRWTEQGYYGSWRVMLSEKVGYLRYEITDKDSGETWTVDPELLLTDWQTAQVSIRPDLIVATAHMLRDHYQTLGVAVEVRANTAVTLNAKPNQQIVDPTVDLTTVSRLSSGSDWLVKLEQTE